MRAVRFSLTRSATDTDGNGVIDRVEFQAACNELRHGVPDRVCDAIFDEMDTDRSNGISHSEYLEFFLRDFLLRKGETLTKALWVRNPVADDMVIVEQREV